MKYNYEDFCAVFGWNEDAPNARIAYKEYVNYRPPSPTLPREAVAGGD